MAPCYLAKMRRALIILAWTLTVSAAAAVAASTSHAAVTYNRLATNRLATNRLSTNRLATNRLATNKLATDVLSADPSAQELLCDTGRARPLQLHHQLRAAR